MMLFFIGLQMLLLLFMLFHDWLPVPPFNDIPALKVVDKNTYRLLGSCVNGGIVLIPLLITLAYHQSSIPLAASITIAAFYFLLTIGTILSWWVPYLFGSSEKHKEQLRKFKHTHHFLPSRDDNVVPNTLHVILHLQVWMCLMIAIYFIIYHI